MLLIFTEHMTNRVQYSMHLLFKELLGIKYQFTNDRSVFYDYEGPRINYSSAPIEDELFFEAAPLLFEKKIQDQELEVFEYGEVVAFFKTGDASALPFDIFAASFYLISRYEECLEKERDQFDRFPAKLSLGHQHGFLKKPIINIWAQSLKKLMSERFPELEMTEQAYSYVPTYDIDIAYSFRGKGFLRNSFGFFNSLRNLDFKRFKERFLVLLGRMNDPYDVYDWMKELHKKHALDPIFFFLVGEFGAYDKNVAIDNLGMQSLIQSIGDFYHVGIHPSYESNSDTGILEREINALTNVIKKDINRSRQHYIKLKLPDTYQKLVDLDITKDYTMGYASQPGFRAGIASSFWYYDLKLEIPLNLRIYPFALMDVTLKEYMKLSPEQAVKEVAEISREVRAVNGLMMTIWHNHSLGETDGWQGWRRVYEQVVKECV